MAKNGNILVVDDNKSILSALEILLMQEYAVTCLTSPNQLHSELRAKDYQLVLLDMNFSAGVNNGNEGLYWLNEIKNKYPDISVVMITAYGDVELAVKALKQGATDFILKPWDNAKLMATIKSTISLSLSKTEVKQLRQTQQEIKRIINTPDKYIIGNSPQLMKMLKMVHKVAKTDTNVLITGENGTGKELVARELHRLSSRNQELLVTVDMGAVSESLFESELFGHTKGAFTDAREDRVGKFEIAHRGTLFLDEIANLPLHLQQKLLVALQSREITRVGSNKPIPVDIRLISATNKDLCALVEEGLFREDLLYRLNTIQIEVPPLRERGEDVLVLSDFFLKKFAHKYDKPAFKVNQRAQEKLLNYHWPGNVRELEHCMEKTVILSDNNVLKPDDLYLQANSKNKPENESLKLEKMELYLIQRSLEKHPDNISASAEELGITRQTLYNKLKKYGLK